MGTVVMPKNSADLEVLIPILEYYYKQNDWVDNANYIAYIKKYLLDAGIDDKEREPQHYTKRMQVLSYFGFIEWEDLSNAQTKRRITNLGKKFYEAVKDDNQQLTNEIIVEALEKTTFGRKNYGVPSSDSDVEAPVLCIRAILDLKYINKVEFAYLLYKVQDNGFTYTTVINEIKDVRAGKLKEIKLPEDANKYTDWKPVNFLERFHFLETESSETRINIEVLKHYKNQLRNLKVYNIDKDIAVFKSQCSLSKAPNNFSPTQIIYYGVPGSGKSHKIDEELQAKIPNKEEREQQSMRVVFHPEYTNADFVGQILPVQTENGLEYPFKAGPFTRILKRALQNPGKPYYLIIEEINRGNAAAIFGDLFQLLDRGSDGWSSYSIENLDINAFIRSENERHSDKNPPKTKQVGKIEFTENTSIRLPPNLSLYATMNTSDQNVFTLDNAFQRRWDMQLVPNECTDTNQMDATITVNNQSIMWKDFQTQINAVIGEKSNEGGLSSMEDKRLGCWFVKAENGEIKASVFADKVLKYLWDDAFKFYHQEMFKGGIKNFEELHKTFLAEGFSVFSDECRLREKLQAADTSTDSDTISE